MKKHIARGIAAMTLALAVGACSDTLSLDAAGDVAMQIQRMSPGLFGAPQGSPAAERSVSPDTVSSFKVTVTSIQFLHSGDSESGTWTTMRLNAPVTIDLMGGRADVRGGPGGGRQLLARAAHHREPEDQLQG